MVLKLYMVPASFPVRAVKMTAKAIGVELQSEFVNLLTGEQHGDKFSEINPARTVPVLDDDGFILPDSHAIMTYLVDKYAPNNPLYPKEDLQRRAKVNSLLYYDCGVVFSRAISFIGPIILEQKRGYPTEEHKTMVHKSYQALEETLISNGNKYMAKELSIADFSLVTTVTSLDVLVPVEKQKYPSLTAWIKRMEQLPYYDANKEGLDAFVELIQSRMPK